LDDHGIRRLNNDLHTDFIIDSEFELIYKSKHYVENSKSENTLRAYRSDWNDFVSWCKEHQREFIPASDETVSLYITHLADMGFKVGTIQRRLSSISIAHQAKNLESPTHSTKVKAVWQGIRNVHGVAQVGKKPLLVEDLKRIVETMPPTLRGLRDRAILLVGFAGAFRRSELVGLDVEDVEFRRNGLTVMIRRSKTDQEGQGRKVGIPYGSQLETCPVRTLEEWLEKAQIRSGPLFRKVNKADKVEPRRLSDRTVAIIVKRAVANVGLDTSEYGGHSLRSGLATSAAIAGASERSIMRQTGHKTITAVRRYIREGDLFRDNAAAKVGL
jgi:site-specific recombinase XerD